MNSRLCMLARSLCSQKAREIISRSSLMHCLHDTARSVYFRHCLHGIWLCFFTSQVNTVRARLRAERAAVLVVGSDAHGGCCCILASAACPLPPSLPAPPPNKLCSYSHLSLDRSVWRTSIFSSCLLKQAALPGAHLCPQQHLEILFLSWFLSQSDRSGLQSVAKYCQ